MTILAALQKTAKASRELATLSEKTVNGVLRDLSKALLASSDEILKMNARDLRELSDTKLSDRLRLTKNRIEGMASALRDVATLPSPLWNTVDQRKRPNGLVLKKMTVPMGVIGMIYEARPNVTIDAFSLCFKAGSACVLKGGSDAWHTNMALTKLIHGVLKKHGVDHHVVYLLPPERSAVKELLKAHRLVDVLIPRGGEGLIRFVREHASIPVIETGAGIVHVYVHESADVLKARRIIFNGKTRRDTVCNALDCVIVDEKNLKVLPSIVSKLAEKNVEIFADSKALKALRGGYPSSLLKPALVVHFGTEFLSPKLAIKTVKNLQGALAHIATFGSKHTEVIVAEDEGTIDIFTKHVDAAAVMSNASPSFTDGGEFGMGSEIGISTQKLHARGPMGLPELTTTKWIVTGNGQTRA